MKPASIIAWLGAFSPAFALVGFGQINPDMLIYAAANVFGFVGLILKMNANKKAAQNAASEAAVQRAFDRETAELQRKWDIEDRELKARELAEKTTAHAEELKAAIADNTDMNSRALNAANQVNEKIASLGRVAVVVARKKAAEPVQRTKRK